MDSEENIEKSRETTQRAAQANYDLDFPRAFNLAMDALELWPDNRTAIHIFNNLMAPVSFCHSDAYDRERVRKTIEKGILSTGCKAIQYGLMGHYYKIEKDYEKAEEAYFRAIFLSRFQENISMNTMGYQLFYLAYIWKNMKRLDVFNRTALSLDWNPHFYNNTRQFALPEEIIEDRLVHLDFSAPPIKNVRILKKNLAKYYLIGIKGELPKVDQFARQIKILDKNNVSFYFYELLPYNYLMKLQETLQHESMEHLFMLHVPAFHSICQKSMKFRGAEILLCPYVREKLKPVLGKVNDYWEITLNKEEDCLCDR